MLIINVLSFVHKGASKPQGRSFLAPLDMDKDKYKDI